MIELLILAAGVIVFIFAAMTIYFIRVIVYSNRADAVLKRLGMFGWADEIARERERQEQAEAWKKNHPRGDQ